MALQTGQGAIFHIGPADEESVDAADYEVLSYTEVGEVESIGEFGDQWDNTTFVGLGTSRTQKFKTVLDAGDPTLTIGFLPSDAGQIDMNEAFEARGNYAVKITLDDSDGGTDAEPTTFYYRAMIMGKRITGIETTSVIRRTISLAINSEVLEIEPVAGT